jgi:hypothetical protein
MFILKMILHEFISFKKIKLFIPSKKMSRLESLSQFKEIPYVE